MKIVIFGLSVSSSWGNGHATLWRGLIRSLCESGHRVVFFERDVAWYASHRDLLELPGGGLVLYPSWVDVLPRAGREIADADVAMVTSYCPDAIAAADVVCAGKALRVFYDLDTPVTLARLTAGEDVGYIPPAGLGDFDLALSYTGGRALTELRDKLGARAVAPLYGSVDPEVHAPAPPAAEFVCDLSYLGTYAEDRQAGVERLLVEPARSLPDRRFLIGGSMYPPEFPWSDNIYFVRHIPPAQHAAFYCSSRLTLNVTRHAMAESGWCPSGRLFEAAACGAAIVSDWWEGLDAFYAPGSEILVGHTTEDVVAAVGTADSDLARIAVRARERTLDCHTAKHRAAELLALLDRASGSDRKEGPSACGESSRPPEKEAASSR